MKKIFSIIAIVFLAVILSACSTKKYELAMITDIGTIDDGSFNQGTWEGVQKYADEKSMTHKYYKPASGSTKDYVDAIDLAVKAGAKVVVTPGYLFSEAIYECQTKYPNVKFILIDSTPADANGNESIASNTYAILFNEHESGFLAGYAAVKAGFTDLGFMGGVAVPAVVRYGYGYLQGAEYAANEMNLADGAIHVKYTYLGGFSESPDYQTQAASWYNSGTEVIFAAAGGAGSSVMSAAKATTGKYVIGVDVNQNADPSVITSAMKELANSVYNCLTALYTNDTTVFQTGRVNTMDATNEGVGLPTDFSKFPTGHEFTLADYTAIFDKLKNNTDNIRTNLISDSTLAISDLNLVKVSVDEI